MPGLVSVADGSKPQPDYAFLPASVRAWGFYVGGQTPHAWTRPELDRVESTGRLGIPIWTAPQPGPYLHAAAQADAAGMLAGLRALGIDDQRWVFLDVEYAVWAADPRQCEAVALYWCDIMRTSGWPRAGWYGPNASTADWKANWNGTPPTVLPAGTIGVQYDHALSGDRYDISRFDPSILDREVTDMDPQQLADAIANIPCTYPDGASLPLSRRVADIDRHLGVDVPAQLANLYDAVAHNTAAINALVAVLTPKGP